MRVIMTGTREWRDPVKVQAALSHVVALNEKDEPVTILHFATNMVDGIVCGLAKLGGFNVVEAAPDWRNDSRGALFKLADRMIPTADLVFTFGNDRVTEHVARVGNEHNVKVFNVEAAKPVVEVIEL